MNAPAGLHEAASARTSLVGWLGKRRMERLRQAFSRHTGEHWTPTDAVRRGLVLGIGLVLLGALLHRVEVLLIGAPLLFTTVISLARPAGGVPRVRALELARVVEPSTSRSTLIDIDTTAGAELLAVRLPDPKRPGPGTVHLLPAGRYRLRCPAGAVGWGEAVAVRPDFLVATADTLRVYGPVVGLEARQITLPPVEPLPAGPLPPRAAGLVGAHRSRRAGDSTELRDIRPFAPGDRLRRVDWRVSLRSGFPDGGALHVRERHADADADVLLALDTRMDVGSQVADWSSPALDRYTVDGRRQPSTIDTTVRAACSLAASYLRQGDRVGLMDLGRPQLYVAPGAGQRQLLRLRHRMTLCAQSAGWAARPVLLPHLVPAGSMVVVLSPFLDDGAVEVAVVASRRGALVVAVDVLPSDLEPDQETPWGPAALAVIRAEHRMRTGALMTHGVPVVSWADEGAGLMLSRLAANQRRRVARVSR